MESSEDLINKKLTAKEILFVNAFLITPRYNKAAEAAGYSSHTACEIGRQIYKRPHVKHYIETMLKESVMKTDSLIKKVNDIADSNLSDYFRPKQRIHIPKIVKGLQQLIDETRQYILDEQEFAVEKGLTDDAYDKFEEGLEYHRDQIIKWKIELRKNPNATRIVEGEPELITEMDLDINAVIADKEHGIIKSVKYDKFGNIMIEGYSALDAAEKLLRINGAFEKDNSQREKIVLVFDKTDEEIGSDVPKN